MEAGIQVMEATIAAQDPYTVGHQQRTTRLACLIAAELNLPKASQEGLHIAGRLRDLGKVAVPAEILTKPGKLSHEEFCLIKNHPRLLPLT